MTSNTMRKAVPFAATCLITFAVMGFTGCSSVSDGSVTQLAWDFEEDKPGRCPDGWAPHQWGKGTTEWRIEHSERGKVFAQLASENPNHHFNLAVYDGLSARNVTLTVRLQARTGKHDQGGGLVWRYQDESNYYIVRANPLEDNVVLYKMENGVRTDLPVVGAGRTYGVPVQGLGNAWHTLKLEAWGDEFTVSLDGRELFRVRDHTHREPGKIGLWTKADAVTWFDDLQVQVHEPR
jgi:hypothetical protein